MLWKVRATNLNKMRQIIKVAIFTGAFGFFAYRVATDSGTFAQGVLCALPFAC